MSDLLVSKYTDPLTKSTMYKFKLGDCVADVAINSMDKWATVYYIETEQTKRNTGLATKLMEELKSTFESMDYKFGGTVALNDAMKRVYEKSGVEEYSDINNIEKGR